MFKFQKEVIKRWGDIREANPGCAFKSTEPLPPANNQSFNEVLQDISSDLESILRDVDDAILQADELNRYGVRLRLEAMRRRLDADRKRINSMRI